MVMMGMITTVMRDVLQIIRPAFQKDIRPTKKRKKEKKKTITRWWQMPVLKWDTVAFISQSCHSWVFLFDELCFARQSIPPSSLHLSPAWKRTMFSVHLGVRLPFLECVSVSFFLSPCILACRDCCVPVSRIEKSCESDRSHKDDVALPLIASLSSVGRRETTRKRPPIQIVIAHS